MRHEGNKSDYGRSRNSFRESMVDTHLHMHMVLVAVIESIVKSRQWTEQETESDQKKTSSSIRGTPKATRVASLNQMWPFGGRMFQKT